MEELTLLILITFLIGFPIVVFKKLNRLQDDVNDISRQNIRISKMLSRPSMPPVTQSDPDPRKRPEHIVSPPPVPSVTRRAPIQPQKEEIKKPVKEEIRISLKEEPKEKLKAAAFVKSLPAMDVETKIKESKFAESSKEILKKIWSWVLVGEEHRPKGVTSEYAMATTWMLRMGILALVMCAVYFLAWSIEEDLISDVGRVILCIIAGIGMMTAGMRLLGKKYHIIGQGLLGGGVLVLYFSVWAASPMKYELIPIFAAFALMILVTITTGYISVRTDSLLIAIIGIAGAFMTPLMLKTSDPHLTALFSYLLMLNLGIFGIANYKQWRLLNYLGFVLTYALFIRAWLGPYEHESHFTIAILFLTGLFVIHSSLVYVFNILRSNKSTALEIIHLTGNAALYSSISYYIIREAHGSRYPAIMSIALAVFFISHVLVFIRKKLIDRNLLIALIGLAGVFTAWTLPLVFSKESLTIAIALFALMLVWLSRKMNSRFMENLGYLAYLVLFVRLLGFDMRENFDVDPSREASMSIYWKAMAGRLWTFGTSIGSIIAAFFMQRGQIKAGRIQADAKNDIPAVVNTEVVTNLFYWVSIFFVFLFLNLEVNTMFSYYTPGRLPALTVLWCFMGIYFLWKHLTSPSKSSVMAYVMSAFLMLVFIKILVIDLRSWSISLSFIYEMEYIPLYAGMRLIDFSVIFGTFFIVWRLLSGRPDDKQISHAFGYAGLFLLFLYMSLETNSLLHWKHPDFQTGGMTVLWAIFAISFISGGLWKNISPLRYTGLILFIIVAGKIFIVDLKHMAMIYRVIAFMVLGGTLILGSFAYIHSSKKFLKE